MVCIGGVHGRPEGATAISHARNLSYYEGALLVTTPSGVTRVIPPPGSGVLEPYELGGPLPDAEVVDLVPF